MRKQKKGRKPTSKSQRKRSKTPRKKLHTTDVPSRRKKSIRSRKQLINELCQENLQLRKKVKDKIDDIMHTQCFSEDLPVSYDFTDLVLMVRDPYWVYAYWNLSQDTKKKINVHKKANPRSKSVIRVYEVSNISNPKKEESARHFDIEVPLEVGQWYIYLGAPKKSFRADLGLTDADGNLFLLAWSNIVSMPLAEPTNEKAHGVLTDLRMLNTFVESSRNVSSFSTPKYSVSKTH